MIIGLKTPDQEGKPTYGVGLTEVEGPELIVSPRLYLSINNNPI